MHYRERLWLKVRKPGSFRSWLRNVVQPPRGLYASPPFYG